MKAYKKCGRENLDLVQWLEPQVNVMIDFQAAEKKRHEEPASEVGLEPLCEMINNNLRCYDLAMELSNSTLEALPQNYAEQDQELCLITQQKSKDADKKK